MDAWQCRNSRQPCNSLELDSLTRGTSATAETPQRLGSASQPSRVPKEIMSSSCRMWHMNLGWKLISRCLSNPVPQEWWPQPYCRTMTLHRGNCNCWHCQRFCTSDSFGPSLSHLLWLSVSGYVNVCWCVFLVRCHGLFTVVCGCVSSKAASVAPAAPAARIIRSSSSSILVLGVQ